MTTLYMLVLSILLAAHIGGVHARLEYVGRIPNGNNVGKVHALGHITWDGDGPLNAFGKAFAAAGYVWTKALCQGDADGDGQTNGEELGDPCCSWREGGATPPLVTDVLSHPGDFGSKLNKTALRTREPRFNHSGSSSRGGNDSIQPPTSAVPTPTVASAASFSRFDRVVTGSTLAVSFVVTLLIVVVT